MIQSLNADYEQVLQYVPIYLSQMPSVYTTAIGQPYMFPYDLPQMPPQVKEDWSAFYQYAQMTYGNNFNDIILALLNDIYTQMNSNTQLKSNWRVWTIEVVNVGVVQSPVVNDLYLIDSITFVFYMVPLTKNPIPLNFEVTSSQSGTGDLPVLAFIAIIVIVAAIITSEILGVIFPKRFTKLWGGLGNSIIDLTWLIGVFFVGLIIYTYLKGKTT